MNIVFESVKIKCLFCSTAFLGIGDWAWDFGDATRNRGGFGQFYPCLFVVGKGNSQAAHGIPFVLARYIAMVDKGLFNDFADALVELNGLCFDVMTLVSKEKEVFSLSHYLFVCDAPDITSTEIF